jgi:membrane peptidoglycan carboxypeptidase
VVLSVIVVTGAVGGFLLWREAQGSALQARLLSGYAARATYAVEADANPLIRFPKAGPYNERLGYAYLPFYIKALQSEDFAVVAQARASQVFNEIVKFGLYPVYHAKTATGLTMFDSNGERIYAASYPKNVFASFDDIPPLLVDTLLFIENRELLRDGAETRNPAIEWDRFLFAAFGQIARMFMPGFNPGGGSTLATQIEKFRYSPQGLTSSGVDKLRQIASASLRVYQDGPDTRAARRKIVLDYLNSTPLSARPGFGEVHSIGDGLMVWFGIELKDAVAALTLPEDSAEALARKGGVYRAALSLILAQRRPSAYLISNRAALDELADATLDRLLVANVVSPALHRASREARLSFLPAAPEPPAPPFIEQKAVNALRGHLMKLLGLRKLYEVDRLDLTAQTTLDQAAQTQLVEFLKKMGDRDFVQQQGLYGFRLLKPDNDPAKIKWSVVLYERGADSNKLRLQADNIDEPFDMNEGMKLDLGSTAKLRTLVTYLEIIAELHRRYAGLTPEALDGPYEDSPDYLTEWVTGWLMDHPTATLDEILSAALERTYSGSPGETFFTGGGAHVFHNFEREEDQQEFTVREAFHHSVNLVFVRLMRDIVNYTIAQGPHSKDEVLDDPDEPARRAYLERFADQEGSQYLSRAISETNGLNPAQRLERLAAKARKTATAYAVLFRSVYPDGNLSAFAKFIAAQPLREAVPAARVEKLYRDYPVTRFNLADRAYLTGLNPMELWLAAYMQAHPDAARKELLAASHDVRIESYSWLFRPKLKSAQDTRIRIMMEEDAFARIHKRWVRLGYPFERLVPSIATAIGSSADRPGALAQLAGIILADGRKLPVERFGAITLAAGTPFHTEMKHDDNRPTRLVLEPEIAAHVRALMRGVVEKGTAKRLVGVYKDADGKPIPVGGKTGTGDHRFDEFGPGGRLISSRVVNRTGTIVFYIGDRFFGAITAHVAGQDAENYVFTSALSAQMLRALAPVINPLVNRAPAAPEILPAVDSTQPLPP